MVRVNTLSFNTSLRRISCVTMYQWDRHNVAGIFLQNDELMSDGGTYICSKCVDTIRRPHVSAMCEGQWLSSSKHHHRRQWKILIASYGHPGPFSIRVFG